MRSKYSSSPVQGTRFSARRLVAGFLRFLSAEAVVLAPLVLFAHILGAEGPMPILTGWSAFVVALLFVTLGTGKTTGTLKAGTITVTILKILAALAGMAGVFTVLVQVSVAHRSLAEAWLDLAREGRAFGFFSFFASEIYALFLIAQSILFIRRRYGSFFTAFIATALLCAGIISGNTGILVLAVLDAFVFFVIAGFAPTGSNPHGLNAKALLVRLKSVSPPVVAAVLFSLWFSFNPNIALPSPFPRPDFEGLFSELAPSFPLIRDVPGYGFSADAAEMPSSVYLSGKTLFRIQGNAGTVHYLATERYRDWNGQAWAADPATGDTIPVSRMERTDAPERDALRLVLEEDFTPAIPLDFDTASVSVSRDAPDKFKAYRNRGIRFEPSIRRGCVADLEPGTVQPTPPDADAIASLLGGAGAKSDRIAALARTLKRSAPGEKDYIGAVIEYLSVGYEYSLKKGRAAKGDNPVESFLFTEKKGFCLYFASAFVLLAREGGLPARLCEGYRVRLDEHGQGIISGNNAHAWPEVWIDGTWQTFEPTPPYRLSDPFALTAKGDRETRRQLEALFGISRDSEKIEKKSALSAARTFVAGHCRLLAMSAGAALVIVLVLLKFSNTGDRKLKRKARKLVRRYARKGVAGPETTGWTAWIAGTGEKASTAEAASDAAKTADAMIALTFAPPRE